jgi:hypothetical protein
MLANREIIENPKESIDRPYDISVAAKEELLLAFLQSILLDGRCAQASETRIFNKRY